MDLTPVKEKPAEEEGTDLLALEARIFDDGSDHSLTETKTKQTTHKILCVPGNVLMYSSAKSQNSAISNTQTEGKKTQTHQAVYSSVKLQNSAKRKRRKTKKRKPKTQRQTKITPKLIAESVVLRCMWCQCIELRGGKKEAPCSWN